MLKRSFQVLTGVLLGSALALWLWGRPQSWGGGPPESEYFLASPLPAPDFALLAHTGARVSSQDFPGKTLVVFFGYTSCPDVCPLTLSKLARAFEEVGERANQLQVLLISVDPQRDTAERLELYLANFHPSFLGLTGPEAEVREVANGFGAFFARKGAREGDYTVDHTARTFVVGPAGSIPLTFPLTASAEEIARDLTRLLGDLP
jgi:protein SCO1/2